MPSHYIKILDFLSNWTSDLDEDRWKQDVFDDITGNGRKLLVVKAPPTAEGPLIGLCGGRWYCEAGRDRDHEDTLFITRLQKADRGLLRSVPEEHRGSFKLITSGARPDVSLDPIGPIFDLAKKDEPTGAFSTLGDLDLSSFDPAEIKRPPIQLGPAATRHLGGEDRKVRVAWRPSAKPVEEHGSLVGSLGKLWRRFDLRRYVVPEPRAQALLSGRIRRDRLSEEDKLGLLRVVDEGVLESLVIRCEQTPWTIQAFMEEFATIPVPVELRAAIWAATLSKLDPTDLRRELNEVEAAIRGLRRPDSHTWEAALLEVLGQLAELNSDTRLQEMLDEAGSAEHPLTVIGEWAASVKFEDEPAPPPTIIAQEERAEPVEPDEPVEPPAPAAPAAPDEDPGESDEPDEPGEPANEPLDEPLDEPVDDVIPDAIPDAIPDEDPDEDPDEGSDEERLSGLEDVVDAPDEEESPEPPPPADDGGSPDEAWVRDRVSRWVYLQRFDDPTEFEEIKESIQARARQLNEMSESMEDAFSLLTLGDLIVELGHDLDRWKTDLPDPVALRENLHKSESALVEAYPVLGRAIEDLVEKRIGPGDLREITGLLEDRVLLGELPAWVWQIGEDDARSLPGPSVATLAQGLVDDETRDAVRMVLGRVKEFGDRAMDILGRIPPPADDDDIQGHVEGFLQQIREEERHIQDAPEEHRAWLQLGLDEGAPVDQLRDALRDLESLRPRIGAEVFRQIVQRLESLDGFEERQMNILQLDDAATALEEVAGTATVASLEQLDNFVTRLATTESLTVTRPAPSLPRIEIEHAFVDARGKKVPLVYWPTGDPDRPFGHVSAPFVIRSDRKRSIRIKLGLKVQTRLRSAWPSDWDAPRPDDIQIEEHEWTAEENGYRYGFSVAVPVRKPAEGQVQDPLAISFEPTHAQDGQPLGDRSSFQWESIEPEADLIPFNWSDSIDWRNVERHPIGCQQRHRRIEQRLEGGNSFAVLSPRRFGKSTLVQYLCRPDEERRLFVATPIVCTSYYAGARLEYSRIWEAVSEDLQEHLGAGITGIHRGLPDNLPDEHAFDHVRKAAKKAGYRGIVLLFDEAQLLFPRHEGPVFGNLLKDRLERHWSRPDLEDMAPIQVGLVGLLSMELRAGTNLMGLLRPARLQRFNERDLNRLILTATSNRLHTTREARVLLAKRTENLYVLKYVLDDLHQLLNDRGQIWADRATVEAVLRKLGKKLRDGRSVTIASYMRDVLNDADEVSQWRPKDCYPLAVAMAGAYREGYWDIQGRMNRAQEILNNWCSMAQPPGLNRLVYTEAQIEQHLRTLRELGIFDDTEFTNRLFAAWLAGRSRIFPSDSEERKVLLDGALERINMPASYEPVQTGTQAQIFRFTEDQKQWALRKVPLLTSAQRERFLETVEMVGLLKDAELRRDEGSQYIYDLRHIGLAANPEPGLPSNADVGIEIYRWIDGIPLDRREGAFGAAIVAQIGGCLARALRLLHSRSILHRDISPSNIILSDTHYFPVLIDFGLARLISGEMGTALASATAAPEVRLDSPSWSPAADIFSLGVTMKQLLRPGEDTQPELASIIDSCTQVSPNPRPSADDLVRLFNAAMRSLDAPDRQRDFWDRTLAVADDDLGKEWFHGVVEKHRASFQTLSLGLHLHEIDRLAEVATFVDQVLEAYPSRRKLKLGLVKNDNAETGKRLVHKNTDLLHGLRTYKAHYSSPDDERKLRTRFGDPADEDLRARVQAGVDEIGRFLSTPTLGRICQLLLEQGS